MRIFCAKVRGRRVVPYAYCTEFSNRGLASQGGVMRVSPSRAAVGCHSPCI